MQIMAARRGINESPASRRGIFCYLQVQHAVTDFLRPALVPILGCKVWLGRKWIPYFKTIRI